MNNRRRCCLSAFSCCDELFFVVNLSIKEVEVLDDIVGPEWNIWLNILWILCSKLRVHLIPFLIQLDSILI
jgi:hypothetical protein